MAASSARGPAGSHMADSVQTFDAIMAEGTEPPRARVARPGLVVLFAGSPPHIIPLPAGADSIELGREHAAFAESLDPRMSRRHASVRFEAHRFIVTDLGSRNGTTVDGDLLAPGASREASRVIRIGDTLLLPAPDITPFLDFGVRLASSSVTSRSLKRPPRRRIAAALQEHEGNISAASRALGVHRTQLRRWIDRYHMDQHAFAPRGEEMAAVSSRRF